ncbi:hypothetical protein [Planktotalea sp.]|uniref:hypothetical protein n=1 Tax=Planktotalea sp. TaxID=2029877 RepID=UPI003D6A0F7A
MNRRQFTRGLASLGLVPAIPTQAIGAGSVGSISAAASAEKMYFVGWYTARLNKTCSAELLASELNVNADVANEIFAKLVKTKTVSAPNAIGISRTVDPLADRFARVTGRAAKQMMQEPSKTSLRERIEKVKATLEEPVEETDEQEALSVQAEAEDENTAETLN